MVLLNMIGKNDASAFFSQNIFCDGVRGVLTERVGLEGEDKASRRPKVHATRGCWGLKPKQKNSREKGFFSGEIRFCQNDSDNCVWKVWKLEILYK